MALHPGERKRYFPQDAPVAWDPIRRALEENEDWCRDLVEHSRDLLCVHDLEGRFLSVNPVPARLLGYSVEEMIGMPMRDFIAPRFRAQFDDYLREIERTGESQGLLAVITRSGEQRIWEYHNTLRTEGVESPIVRGMAHDVTERVRAEKALRASNERLQKTAREQELLVHGLTLFRTLLDQSNDVIQVVDPKTMRFLDVNERACVELGYSREELLSMTVRDVDPVTDEGFEARLEQQLRKTGIAIFERTRRRKDGTTFPVEVNLRRVRLDREYDVAVARDITERKQAEEALRESEARERARAKELETVLEAVPVPVMIAHDAKCLRITANRAGYEQLRVPAGTNFSKNAPLKEQRSGFRLMEDGVEIPAHLLPMPLAGATGKPVYGRALTLVFEDGTERETVVNAVPLLDEEGTTRGVVGALIDLTEQKQAEKALRESERRFRAVYERSPVGISLVDSLSGRFLQVNPKFCEIAGRSAEELLRIDVASITHPDDIAHGSEYLRQLAEEKLANYEMDKRYLRPDGSVRWVRILVVPMWGKGEKGRWHMALVEDITERRQAEEAIATLVQQVRADSSENFFTSMALQLAKCLEADHTYIGELIAGADKVRTLGVCSRGAIADNVTYDLPHSPCEGVLSHGTRSYVSGVAEAFPKDLVLQQLNVEGYVGTPLRDSQGRVIGVMAAAYTRPLANAKFAEMILHLFSTRTAAEIERMRTEEALRQSEAELRQSQRIGQMGSWYRDLTTDTFTWSEQLYRLLGMDPKEQAPHFTQIERFFAPESYQRLVQANEKLISAGGQDKLEVEFRRQDGTSGWALLHREAVRDEAGNIIRIRGIALDITERRRTEEALRQSEERFRVALKNSPIAVFNQDRDLRYTWMYNSQPPLSDNEKLGKTVGEIFDRAEAAHATEVRRRVLETGVGMRHEMRLTYGGREHYFDTTIEPVLDAAGAVIGLTGASMDVTELRETSDALREAKKKLTEEKLYLEQEIDAELGFGEIVGQSKALQAVMENVGKVAASDATVLLLGETGTGKELVARALHRLSQRANNSFIKLNCAAIPSGLLESELFGNEKGAFTGAVSKKIGRLELADKGTLFLDEIGEISLGLQPKLLRVLQDQEFERLGGTQTLKVDFRLIAATNRDLEDSVRENEFRSDLYYRLNVFPIRVPPLRERREDIQLLVEHFVQKFARRMNRQITSIPKKTMDALMEWEWPGNVRELENFIERSVILTQGSVLVSPLSELRPSSAPAEEKSADDTLEAAERDHILRALRESHEQIGGLKGAAMRLGLKRTTLQSKLKHLGINPRSGPAAP